MSVKAVEDGPCVPATHMGGLDSDSSSCLAQSRCCMHLRSEPEDGKSDCHSAFQIKRKSHGIQPSHLGCEENLGTTLKL